MFHLPKFSIFMSETYREVGNYIGGHADSINSDLREGVCNFHIPALANGQDLFYIDLGFYRELSDKQKDKKVRMAVTPYSVVPLSKGRLNLIQGIQGTIKLKREGRWRKSRHAVASIHYEVSGDDGEATIEEITRTETFNWVLTHELAHVYQELNHKRMTFWRDAGSYIPPTCAGLAMGFAQIAGPNIFYDFLYSIPAFSLAWMGGRFLRDINPYTTEVWARRLCEKQAVLAEQTMRIQVRMSQAHEGIITKKFALEDIENMGFFDPDYFDTHLAPALVAKMGGREEMVRDNKDELREMIAAFQDQTREFLTGE